MSGPWDSPDGSRTDSAPPAAAGGRAAARVAARGGGRGRRKQVSRVRRGLRVAAISMAALVLATAGAGAWFYHHLNGNLHSVSLSDGANGDVGGTEKADAFGRTPINILVIGSDGRSNKANCKLGGGCGRASSEAGQNADVEMVVHVSADRSNATVMSVPRDTVTRVPACRNADTGASTPGYQGMINSALLYGPACQVATVHQLTGIPIDHFVMLDFSGVVTMSDAVGGVSVCVSDDVYDTYSHLKLAKGSHTLKGDAALEFVRSRHGFGDGSDLGRTYAQHIFLGSMIRKFKSAGTLTNPAAVYRLADAATKALTVDTGLGSVTKLIGLAGDLDKVPSRRMIFTTMQTSPDPADPNRVVVGAGADALFASIADDQPLTSPDGSKSPAASATAEPTATVPAARITVRVENGTGTGGRAAALAGELTAKGFAPGTSHGNAPAPAATTTLTYGAGQQDQARTVARVLGIPGSHLKQDSAPGLTLVIGADWGTGTVYPGGTPSAAPVDTRAAVAQAHAQTADQGSDCAPTSHYKTVRVNGVPMTPTQAYAVSTKKADSAP